MPTLLNYRVRREFKSSKGLIRVGTILTSEEARGLKNFSALLNTNYLNQHEVDDGATAPASSKKGKRK